MKRMLLGGFAALVLALSLAGGEAEARRGHGHGHGGGGASIHLDLGFWPFLVAPFYYGVPAYEPPPVIYYAPRRVPEPPRRYDTVTDTYREGDCKVTERSTYDDEGFVVDRKVLRDCADGAAADKEWLYSE